MGAVNEVRRAKIAGLADLNEGTGLEIGPLASPIALAGECDVRYVDVYSFEKLKAHYGTDPAVDVDSIVPIDYTLTQSDGSIVPLSEAVRPGAPYQWVIASHVIEHVPDLVGWLADISEIMVAGGQLVLAVPDRRFTFDLHRPQTTIGQILQAHYNEDRVPSIRAIYDHFRSVIQASPVDLWQGKDPGVEARIYTEEQAMGEVARVRETGEYLDAHVWMFTPSSFVEQIAELGRLGLCPFVVERVVPTALNELEFYAVLRKDPRGSGAADGQPAVGIQSLEDAPLVVGTESGAESEPAPERDLRLVPTAREVRLIEVKRRIFVALKGLARRARKSSSSRAQRDGR